MPITIRKIIDKYNGLDGVIDHGTDEEKQLVSDYAFSAVAKLKQEHCVR